MVIYHGTTSWHILHCWLHRIKKHSDDAAILILPDFILDKYPNIMQTFPSDIFSIYIIRYRKLNFNSCRETFEQTLQSIVDNMNINQQIYEATDIYVAGAQYMFSHYLIQHNISFHFIEEAPGRLTTSEIVKENLKNINNVQYEIAYEDGMFSGNSHYVKKIICNKSAQAEDSTLPCNSEDFDAVMELQNLSEEDIEKIKNFFNVPNMTFPENTALVLTQHFANLNMTDYIGQAVLYQMTVDYFLEGNQIYIKPHPDDLMNYTKELECCEVIHGTFPSELLQVVSKNKPAKLLAINSASILNVKKYYNEIIYFNQEYLETFLLNHQYYLFGNIVRELNLKDICISSINQVQLINILKTIRLENINIQTYKEDNDIKSICFIGKNNDGMFRQTLSKSCKRDTIYAFLDPQSWLEFSGSKDACLRNGICKSIYITAIYQEEYPETGAFYLYIYCEDENIRRRIAKMHYIKRLVNSGIETTVPQLDDKDMEIAVLKGILAATEKRLYTYLNNEKGQIMAERK